MQIEDFTCTNGIWADSPVHCYDNWVPVSIAWHILKLCMDKKTSRYGRQYSAYKICSCGPPACRLDKELTAPHHKRVTYCRRQDVANMVINSVCKVDKSKHK
jgi:hypothetical protein